jgi:hypothetical protein
MHLRTVDIAPCPALAPLLIALSLFLLPATALSQTVPATSPGSAPPTVTAPPSPGPDEIATLKEDAARKDAKIAKLEAKSEALEKKLGELSAKVEGNEAAEFDQELSTESGTYSSAEKALDVYGFFNVDLFAFDTSDVKASDGLLVNHPSFMVDRINLYFLGRLSDTLSALLEFRFSFLPNGYETSIAEPVFLGTQYGRVDTTVVDPLTSYSYQYGSVAIERAHLTWMPYEFFGVMAGRYITPYGLWNVDHGSPVVLPLNGPNFLSQNPIPSAQTGLQFLGRVIPLPHFYIDYAITVSNGRGPVQAVYDVDNNKALGARLKFAYDSREINCALGGYLYWGDSTDISKTIKFKLSTDEKGVANYTYWFDVDETERFNELTGSLDLSVEYLGFILKSEYFRGQVRYDARPTFRFPVLNLEDPLGGLQPDYNRWAIYGLLGYKIPIQTTATEMSLTPFVMIEYDVFSDVFDNYAPLGLRGGLNFKPSPYVTVKVEFDRMTFPTSELIRGVLWHYAAQLAVSF